MTEISFVKEDFKNIIDYLYETRNIDISACRWSIVNQQIRLRLKKTGFTTPEEYYLYCQSNSGEITNLVEAIDIKYSLFFRDPLMFNYLFYRIFPLLITDGNKQLRIWSAGCATGEEPYSVAMEIQNFRNTLSFDPVVSIFATDIDSGNINNARAAVYKPDSLNNVRYEYLRKFTRINDNYHLNREIVKLVNFSVYDLLDKKFKFPSESVYSGFDIILCRNVLIYYDTTSQNKIITRLFKALNKNGYLVLGEIETPVGQYKNYFKRVNECCSIFQKTDYN